MSNQSSNQHFQTRYIKTKKKRKRFIKKFDKKTIISYAVLIGVILVVAGSLVLLVMFAWYGRELTDITNLSSRSVVQSTKIYDRTEEHLLYEIHGDENRTIITLEEIPDHAKWAIIAAEDQQFYQHMGFNPLRLINGAIRSVLGDTQGGSTITQQFVKNAILSPEQTISRKVKELILSIELERRYSKDEILEMYFNQIPYGSTNYGIESAANSYFDKHAKDLTMAESATLAALPNRPTTLLNNPDLLEGRRDTILQQMVDEGYIKQEEADVAQAEELEIQQSISDITAPHFIMYVKQLLEEEYGQRTVEQGGLKVITTIDYDMQIAAETAVTEGVDARSSNYNFSNAALVALDPKSGHILAMVGSKDFFDEDIDGAVNVTLRPRQPGSSFKPIVYTAGFQKGYTPNTILYDVLTTFKTETKDYQPNNYDLVEHGPITIRSAVQGSINITAVKMLYLVGVDYILDFAEEIGYTSFGDRSRFGLSLVLGGGEVKLIEHTAAYGVFANNGIKHETTPIIKIEQNDDLLFEWEESSGKKVIDEQITNTISNVLSDNNARAYVFGTDSYLQLGDRPVAAKTGTTNDYRDAWTIGYTPSLVAGVWAGNNDNSEMARGAGGSTVAAPIWNAFMREALSGEEIESFQEPDIPATGKPILDGQVSSQTVTIDRASGLLATEYTPDSFREDKTFVSHHSILMFVDRDNPLSDYPAHPEDDPQFSGWEASIQEWITRVEEETGIPMVQEEPPTEYDNLHVPANFPETELTQPDDGDTVSDREVVLRVDTSSERGVSRVEYYIDNNFIGSSNSFPFTLRTQIPNYIEKGFHTLKAISYDDIDNSGSDEITINLTADPEELTISITIPANGAEIITDNETLELTVYIASGDEISKIDIYAEYRGSGERRLIKSIIHPDDGYNSTSWTIPGTGEYILQAKATDRNDDRHNSEQILITFIEPEPPPEKENPEEEEINIED